MRVDGRVGSALSSVPSDCFPVEAGLNSETSNGSTGTEKKSTNTVPMALAVKFQLDPQAEPFAPTGTVHEKLESRCGKWNKKGAGPVSKHNIGPGGKEVWVDSDEEV